MTTEELARFPLPASVRWFSVAGDRWRERIVPFTAEGFLRGAQRITGLQDYGDDDGFVERVEQAVASLREVDLNLIGRFAAKTMMHWHLANRLNMVEALRQRPEIRDVPVEAPIVVVGLFRTGTTFLHNVLAADPALRAGTMWEVSYPVGRQRDPLGDVPWRRRRTSIPLTMNHVVVPDQDVVHYVDIDAFEEDFFLLGTDMAMMTQFVGLGDWARAWQLLEADLRPAFRWHRLQLQALAMQQPTGRWVLKCPWHLWNLDALLDVYPDARIIHIHRDPANAIGSHCSLMSRIVCRMQRSVDVRDVSRFWVEYSRVGLERGQAVKERMPSNRLADVRLRDLRKAPGATLRGIYEQLELPWHPELEATFDARAAEDPTQQHGVHEYTLEQFGLDAEAVRAELADYCERFGV